MIKTLARKLTTRKAKYFSRYYHKWIAMIACVPLLIISVTGGMLLLKKQFTWIQPPSKKGTANTLQIDWEQILNTSKSIEELNVNSWGDIERLDVRPGKGIVKIRSQNNWEMQMELATGKVRHTQFRRSDIIESIHDGSWFHDKVKYIVFLPAAFFLFFLVASGMHMFFIPKMSRIAKNG